MKKVKLFQSMQWKIIIIMILLLLLAIQVIGSYFAQRLENDLTESFEENVDERLDVLSYNLEEALKKERPEDGSGPTLQDDVEDIVGLYGRSDVYSKLQVIDRQFRIIGTNAQEDIGKLVTGDSGVRPAIIYGTTKRAIQRDTQTSERRLVRIVPLYDEDEPLGAIYLEASMEEVYDQLDNINNIFLNGTLIAIIISALVGILVARAITKPITEMRRQAMIMSQGDFSQKVNVYGTDEIGQLAMTFNDMNEKIKQANHTTEEERRKLSSVLSNMSDGVLSTNEKGIITLMNEPAAILIGKSFEEVKGQSIIDVLQLEDKKIDLTEFQEAGSITIDFSDDEQFFLIKANFSTVQDENEQFSGLITVISDVTEQEKVEKERREFVSNVSHELRTPLTTMRSYMEALIDGAWEDKEIAPQFLEVTQNETERMIRLVNDLLQLSKMDHKEQSMYKERVNIVPFFHHVLDRFEMNKEELIVIERHIPKDSLFLWIDKDKIIQVIDNVMSNAIKYSSKGGKITFGVIKEKQRIKVSISDKGPGISREKLDKIFERFYRADRARSRQLGGTGLGLAIAKEIINAHHGQIWAESAEGKGTTIFFTLPLINRKRGMKK
ncbi:PAS domain-containing sensor histidine kinase [Paraliobacillus quinghaiensis]|uniref:histidine kinase n=1 Tax=Paraliobacillus quinghaiensis TaxID=470815 RepID=A0A917TM61_9BACI|nr:cell wall metabolism sensor histidine kinase WalK [Paraliobacillus quinghaiensis]GGM28411.1 PAS domain-containing sensor histidine kinase [Paraliobacillus quinghaiensis]